MDFSLWIATFPGLLWEIEHRRSRLKLLNQWATPSLGEDTARMLKDARFRRRVVVKSDHTLLDEFWEMVSSRQAALVSFRLNGEPDVAYCLQGWPHPHDPEKYFGMLKESVLPAAFVADGEAGFCQLSLGRAQYPVLILNVRQKEIATCNETARNLFAGAARGGNEFMLDDIAPGDMGKTLLRAARHALEEEVWAGAIRLRNGAGSIPKFKVRISPCSAGPDIVRIALLNIPERQESGVDMPDMSFAGEPFSLRTGLEKLLALCPGVSGLMFSDIQSWHGRVEVYGVGRLFSSLAWGAPHAYEGKIAQDIERFGLESLVVEDTLDSIKSIDWAVFIPCGVRSYFAKPFYSAQGLHAVLIFAFDAPAPGAFSDVRFRPLYEPFARLVARWRTMNQGQPS